jgi:flagellar motor switch protein FliG
LVERATPGKKKAAMLLMALGKEASVKVFKNLTEEEINEVTFEIANIGSVSPDEKDTVIEEFYHISRAHSYISKGGVKYASEILEQAVGKDKANNIIDSLTQAMQAKPFEFLKKADPEYVIRFIQDEQPQTIALILAH